MKGILDRIREELQQEADEKTRQSGLRFFKEPVRLYGIKSAAVETLGKRYLKELHGRSKVEILQLCEELWQSGYMEESFIACMWAYSRRKEFTPEDFPLFERWVDAYVSNWAACDTLCNHTIGTFIQSYPAHLADLKRWARSPNRWMRRAAAVSLIIPARQGDFLPEIFELADILLMDEDDMVRKGYGWMLKAASQAHQQEVFEFVMARKAVMPRTSLRYAIEKMPKALKEQAMAREPDRRKGGMR